MANVVNIEAVVQEVGRWSPQDLAAIRSLQYDVSTDGAVKLAIEFVASRRDLARNGWPSDEDSRYVVSIRFSGVKDLTLRQFGANNQIMGFDIQDISERGWEGCNFLIDDYESGKITFRCDGIEILNVQRQSRDDVADA
jgi:hypothetical protein